METFAGDLDDYGDDSMVCRGRRVGRRFRKPCLSTIVERRSLAFGLRVGLAEMNGWRDSMEDAHVIHLANDWAFLGVFDGHSGSTCSEFVSEKIQEELYEHGCPPDDEAVRNMVLRIDKAFLDTFEGSFFAQSGSCGAMCVLHRPGEPGGQMKLRVINVGDSRVFLGHADGTIFEGPGTDSSLSTDHKPDHPDEKERIERCGGSVLESDCARVNGRLAVSRAFGDAKYKQTGGPGPEDTLVTAYPELGEFECDESDFLVIACDGVFEGRQKDGTCAFPTAQVVQLIAEELSQSASFAGGPGDPGVAAKKVVLRAEQLGSKDNITCMVVVFTHATESVESNIEFTPGPFHYDDDHLRFVGAYETMAQRAGLTLAKAVEMRYEACLKELPSRMPRANPILYLSSWEAQHPCDRLEISKAKSRVQSPKRRQNEKDNVLREKRLIEGFVWNPWHVGLGEGHLQNIRLLSGVEATEVKKTPKASSRNTSRKQYPTAIMSDSDEGIASNPRHVGLGEGHLQNIRLLSGVEATEVEKTPKASSGNTSRKQYPTAIMSDSDSESDDIELESESIFTHR